MATPQSGNHHDLKDIQALFDELCRILTEAKISLRGVFMNADSGFDAEVLREQCLTKETEANIAVNKRNKGRFVIERMNAWIDSFKALLLRFETNVKAWMALHFLAFAAILCKKINIC